MKKVDVLIGVVIAIGIVTATILAAGQRYPVGQPVTSSVYTEPFDPCDPAYKFLQAPPKDWAEKFGNSERTMLIHAVSELRVVVAVQGQRILALEKWRENTMKPDPNETFTNPGNAVPITDIATTSDYHKDPNEARKMDDTEPIYIEGTVIVGIAEDDGLTFWNKKGERVRFENGTYRKLEHDEIVIVPDPNEAKR